MAFQQGLYTFTCQRKDRQTEMSYGPLLPSYQDLLVMPEVLSCDGGRAVGLGRGVIWALVVCRVVVVPRMHSSTNH